MNHYIENPRDSYDSIEVTPQILLDSFHHLHHRYVLIRYSQLLDYIKTHYIVEQDLKVFNQELLAKLHCAVQVGLIENCGDDKYGLPTFLQEANTNRHAIPLFRKFWDEYYREINYKNLPNLRKRM